MNSVTLPIATSTSLSVFIHGIVFAALLLSYEQATTTGPGVEIELIRSTRVSDQPETDVPRNSETMQLRVDKQLQNPTDKTLLEQQRQRYQAPSVLTLPLATVDVSDHENPDNNSLSEQQPSQFSIEQNVESRPQITDQGNSLAPLMRSTNSAQQQHSILELLHDSISDNKKYPYIARRQRREGVATVAFVLHPDGSIENAHLLISSSAAMLDRAALSAVKGIEPFTPARNYLDHAAEFRIDVVFNLQ